jgi:hypothetical protein
MSNSTARPGIENHDWTQAAEKAKEAGASLSEMTRLAAAAVGAIASHAASDVSVLAGETVRVFGKKADELAYNAGIGIQGLGDLLSKNSPEAGILRNASDAVAGVVKEGGKYLKDAKLTGLTEDVSHVIRRNPIQSVLIAAGVGWFIGRKLKG